MGRKNNRKQRWKTACAIEGLIFLFMGSACFIDSNGGAKVLGLILLFTAWYCYIEHQRGWKINYKIPNRAYRHLNMGGRSAEIANKAIASTIKESKNPNRKRYAFE